MSFQQLIVLVCVFLINVNSLPVEKSKPNPPHILIIFYGSKIHTPNIDSLAKDGVILDNFQVQLVCTPTRTALTSQGF